MITQDNYSKLSILKDTIKDIEDKFGKGTIIYVESEKDINHKSIKSGSLLLDKTLGIGGVPMGKMTEIIAENAVGKTTLLLNIIKTVQKNNGIALFIDMEHALDMEYAKKLGVNMDELLIAQPSSGEQALEIINAFLDNKCIDLIGLDSVTALVPQEELSEKYQNLTNYKQINLVSRLCREIVGKAMRVGTTLVFLNQIRERLDGQRYVSPLEIYSYVTLKLTRGKDFKDIYGTIYGHEIKMNVQHNRLAPSNKFCKVDLIYGEGFDNAKELFDIFIKEELLLFDGETNEYWYHGESLGLREDALDWIRDNYNRLISKI